MGIFPDAQGHRTPNPNRRRSDAKQHYPMPYSLEANAPATAYGHKAVQRSSRIFDLRTRNTEFSGCI